VDRFEATVARPGFAGRVRDEVAAWAAGKRWEWRAALLVYFGFVGVRHLADPLYSSLFGGINLGIHEAGHLVFGFLGQWLMTAGGTILQCAVPVVAGWLLLRQGEWFGLPVAGFWEATNLYSVATYMADARALELPLVTVGADGGEVEHDWSYLLYSVGLLQHDTAIASAVRLVAFLLLWGSIALGIWMLVQVHRRRGAA
jgi:hypothetical protein